MKLPPRTTGWRRIATGTWGWPNDPQILGRLEVDAQPILDAIDTVRDKTGAKVTVTHVVVRALAYALAEAPEINTKLAFGRFVPRDSVDVFVIVSTGAGSDLSGVKIVGADKKSIVEVAAKTERGAGGARAGRSELERAKHLMQVLPVSALHVALRFVSFLTTDLGLDLKRIGLPREPFGSAMVSSVGMFGITEGWTPLSPLYRVPAIMVVGQVAPAPWVIEGRVVTRPVLPITVTIDHRWVDGHTIARLAKAFRAYLADPLAYEPKELSASRPKGGRRLQEVK